jgi:hypothetical protein
VRDSDTHGDLGFAAHTLWTHNGKVQSSDIRLKDPQSIRTIKDALLRVKELNPVHFRYKDQPVDSLPKLGFIAQEMEAVLPEVVSLGPEGMKGIQEGCLVALLAQAIKEQQAQIDALRAELAGANLDLAQVGIGRMAIQADLQVS